MDVQEYILSGVLENYVLGLASDEERQEVMRYAAIYPEIRAELDAIEQALETYAFSNAIMPPAGLDKQLLEKLKPHSTPVTSPQVYRGWWIGAGVLLILGIAYLWFQNVRQQQQLATSNTTIAQLQAEYETLERTCLNYNAQIALLKDSITQVIPLEASNNPDSKLIVHWNKPLNKILLSAINLPQLNADEDYQLWAIINGNPTDMGVINIAQNLSSPTVLLEIPVTFQEQPQQFAISIEPKGGSTVPTLSKIYAVGSV